jgi:hypothetical protein
MITIDPGVQVGGGITIGNTYTPPPPPDPGLGASITYDEMPGPVVAGQQLQDSTATVNNPIGFTINNGNATGITVTNLSLNNRAYFALHGMGYYNITFGDGSSYPGTSCNVVNINGATVVFNLNYELQWPATFNYPLTLTAPIP